MKDFPIPVVAYLDQTGHTGQIGQIGHGGLSSLVGPGSQPDDGDDVLDYLAMPQGMATFRAPPLPEPEDAVACVLAHRALRQAVAALGELLALPPAIAGAGLAGHWAGATRRVSLAGLPAADLLLVNQVLGEGEVSAVVAADGAGTTLRVQESVFAGVWRVIQSSADGTVLADHIELGAVPQALREAALADVVPDMPRWAGALPPQVQNAPALLTEAQDAWRAWLPGQLPHVLNLTLLPMTPEDIGFLDHHLGTGRVLLLSRGYGNCRISNTLRPHCWRVVYYNSQDVVILNTVEVSDLPEVAQAALEDLQDSHERLADVLVWVTGGTATEAA
jgi:hydrogenase-1 operon protein HyaF